ncbi:MAG: hypothetical protein Q8P20_00375 [bacterium]|nr:hypothetical protein [bacterium]
MNINNLKVELDVREDANKNIFHLGRLRAPCKIDLTRGVTFLIFVSDSGEEELQIACNDKENTIFSKCYKQSDRFKVPIEDREDQYKKTFYVAKIQYNGYIDCGAKDGVVFIVFTSKAGAEELQIVGEITNNKTALKAPDIDIIYNR